MRWSTTSSARSAAATVLGSPCAEERPAVTVEELRLDRAGFYDLVDHFASRPDFALLDSRTTDGGLGTYSLFAFAPFARLTARGDAVTIGAAGSERTIRGDPLDELHALLDRYRIASLPSCPVPLPAGAIGYLAYELGRTIEDLPATAVDAIGVPDIYLCFYNFAVTLSHEDRRVFLSHVEWPNERAGLSLDEVRRELAAVRPRAAAAPAPAAQPAELPASFEPDLSAAEYLAAVRRIKEYIYAGDVYQVNMTQRFTFPIGDARPWDLYTHLCEVNPAPFAGFLNFDGHAVVSSSPERFLLLRDRDVQTRPIKGTIRRGATVAEDVANRAALLYSAKNRAELAMIVDLLRNDLGRVCTPGSVEVKAFAELESYASVHHLVATITGELADGRTVVDLIRAAFPGGSITGAPKIRAMEIIDELEPVTRGVYTGSIGYFAFDGNADLNIAIRTIIVRNGTAHIQAGGGIVADSDERDEYEESLLKAGKLFQAVRGACGRRFLPADAAAL